MTATAITHVNEVMMYLAGTVNTLTFLMKLPHPRGASSRIRFTLALSSWAHPV